MKTRNEQPEASVSSGSIDLEALRALVEKWRTHVDKMFIESDEQRDPHRKLYVDGKAMGMKYCADELSSVLASLGERRRTQEEKVAREALAFYADIQNWYHETNDDRGHRARLALSSSCSPAPPQEQP